MQRFKRFIGMDVNGAHLNDMNRVKDFGMVCKYLPASIEEFEECEFLVDPDMKDVTLCVAILEGKIKRIMFVQTDPSDPEVVAPLSEDRLKEILEKHGERLEGYFSYITQKG